MYSLGLDLFSKLITKSTVNFMSDYASKGYGTILIIRKMTPWGPNSSPVMNPPGSLDSSVIHIPESLDFRFYLVPDWFTKNCYAYYGKESRLNCNSLQGSLYSLEYLAPVNVFETNFGPRPGVFITRIHQRVDYEYE